MHHHEPGFLFIDFILEHIEHNVSDSLDHMTIFMLCGLLVSVVIEFWLEVLALTIQNIPVIESSLGWDNRPWKEYEDPALKGYQWDQSSIPKIYKVADSASYLKPYDQRDHSWNDAEYNQSDEVKFLDNTKTLSADYLENLAPAAEYHLREGRTGVDPADEV